MCSHRLLKKVQSRQQRKEGACRQPQLNHLWSVWYCTMTVAFQIYIIASSIQRFMRYITLPWPPDDQPYIELNAYVGFVGAAVVLLPFFVVSALLKVGNFSNDGQKVGETSEAAIYQNLKRSKYLRWLKTVWRHGGPTAPILHMTTAFCLLVPRVLIHAQLIRHGFLSRADVWKTDLDFIISHKDRLVKLNFLSSINQSEVISRDEADSLHPLVSTDPVQLEEVAPLSAEFLNYMAALMVHAVRYPSVFWRGNKSFGMIFSMQLVLDSIQKLLAFAGFSVLYKVHIVGPRETLLDRSSLLLNVPLSVLLFLIYNLVLTLSGSVLYIYGLQKFREWRESRAQKTHVTWKDESKRLWGYVPHISSFLVLLMIALTASPLMYDFTVVYCGSLDGVVLAGVLGTVCHLFMWLFLWLILTIKQHWQFNRVSRPYRSPQEIDGKETPLLVIGGSGQTYQVREKSSKSAIMNMAQKAAASQAKTPDDEEDIYWLKPKPPSSKGKKDSSPESDRLTWLKGGGKKSPAATVKHKVSFEEKGTVLGSPCKRTRSASKSPKSVAKNKKQQNVTFEDLSDTEEEDGDYATLRELVAKHDEEALMPKSSFRVIGNRYQPKRALPTDDGDYELLVDESHKMSAPVIVHTGSPLHVPTPSTDHRDDHSQGNLTPRSDSVSDTSTSPEKGAGSESSSSGVHSNCSISGDKRCSSMENLIHEVMGPRTPWKSMSLQRGVPPPNEHNFKAMSNTAPRTCKPDPLYYDPPDSTLVIRRKQKRSNQSEDDGSDAAEPFGRATNMRMTSFTDQPDFFPNGNVLSLVKDSTPTSPKLLHCNDGNENTVTPMKLINVGHYCRPHVAAAQYMQHQRRDSANYSLTSSGDSDTYGSHHT